MNRMRVVGWRVQPIIMADDGDQLTPVTVQAADIPAAEWPAFKNGGDDAALAELRGRLESSDDD